MKTEIIYEDKGILVCRKPTGLAVQTAVGFQTDAVSELKNYLYEKSGEKNPYLGVVHRIDQPVEGLLVFAKTKQVAADLSRQLTEGSLKKKYLAVLDGVPDCEQGILTDYLKKDSKTNLSMVVSKQDKDGKHAELSYRILAKAATETVAENQGEASLAEIEIKTGRHHQIRVQMSHLGCPLAGDTKYGSHAGGQLALCAYYLELRNPTTGKWQKFTAKPRNTAFAKFGDMQRD